MCQFQKTWPWWCVCSNYLAYVVQSINSGAELNHDDVSENHSALCNTTTVVTQARDNQPAVPNTSVLTRCDHVTEASSPPPFRTSSYGGAFQQRSWATESCRGPSSSYSSRRGHTGGAHVPAAAVRSRSASASTPSPPIYRQVQATDIEDDAPNPSKASGPRILTARRQSCQSTGSETRV